MSIPPFLPPSLFLSPAIFTKITFFFCFSSSSSSKSRKSSRRSCCRRRRESGSSRSRLSRREGRSSAGTKSSKSSWTFLAGVPLASWTRPTPSSAATRTATTAASTLPAEATGSAKKTAGAPETTLPPERNDCGRQLPMRVFLSVCQFVNSLAKRENKKIVFV